MKHFARVMGLLFGSAGAYIFPRSGHIVLWAGSYDQRFY